MKHLQQNLEILNKNYDSEAIKNSIQSRFSKDLILEKYFEVFESIVLQITKIFTEKFNECLKSYKSVNLIEIKSI